jgi:hypothetical protein
MVYYLLFEYIIRKICDTQDRSDRTSVTGFGVWRPWWFVNGFDSRQFNARELNQARPASTMPGAPLLHRRGGRAVDQSAGLPIGTREARPEGERHGWRESMHWSGMTGHENLERWQSG